MKSQKQSPNKDRGLDGWLNQMILCGLPHPITRAHAIERMVDDGMERTEAVRACCYFREVGLNG